MSPTKPPPSTEAAPTRVAARLRHGGGALPLRTPRLILRPPARADAGAVTMLAGAWAIARFTANIPHPLTERDVLFWFGQAESHHAKGSAVVLLMTARDDGAVLGAIDLRWDKTWPAAEVGYWVGLPFHRQGYASEALTAVLGLAFGPLALDAVFASACADNSASQRVLHKAGLHPDGHTLVVPAPARGVTWHHERRTLTRDTWAALTQGPSRPDSPTTPPDHQDTAS